MSETIEQVTTSQESVSTPQPVTQLVEPTPSRTSIRDAFDAITADELIGISKPNSMAEPVSSSSEDTSPKTEVSSSSQVAPGSEGEQAQPLSEETSEPESIEPLIPRRMVKATLDSEAWEIPDNAKVEYKVNGVPVTRTIKEVLQMQSGIENTDRYWQQLKKEKENWKGYIGSIVEQTKAGKGLEALTKAIADQGEDPVAFQRNLLNSLIGPGRQYLEMTDEERKALEIQQENEYYRKQMQQRESLERQEAERLAAIRAIKDVEARYQMPEGAWSAHYEELASAQKAGQIPEGEITIDDVGRYFKVKSAYTMVGEAVKQLGAEAAIGQEEIQKLVLAVQEQELTKEELADILGKRFAKKPTAPVSSNAERAEKNLSEKLATSPAIQSLTPNSEERTEASGSRRRPRDLW